MNQSSIETIAEAFSRTAEKYDSFAEDHPHLTRMRNKVYAHVMRYVPRGAHILEPLVVERQGVLELGFGRRDSLLPQVDEAQQRVRLGGIGCQLDGPLLQGRGALIVALPEGQVPRVEQGPPTKGVVAARHRKRAIEQI